MAEVKWNASTPVRFVAASCFAAVYGVQPAIRYWGDPLLVGGNLVLTAYVTLVLIRDGRLTTSGNQVLIRGALRTQRIEARDIAGIAASTVMPSTVLIWTLDGQFVRTAAPGKGTRNPRAVQARVAELDAWFEEHRGAEWSLDSLVRA